MLIKQPPMTIETSQEICGFHKRNPGKQYAGCACSALISGKVKPFNEWTDGEKFQYFDLVQYAPRAEK